MSFSDEENTIMSEQHLRPSTDLAFSIKRVDLLFWISWVEMTVLGGIASLSLLYFLTLIPNTSLPLPWSTYVDFIEGATRILLLATPLFFISLCQWFLLRRFVTQPGLWLIIGGMCGPLATFVYFIGAFTFNGFAQPLGFQSPDLWFDAGITTIVGLIVGGLVGGLQSLLIERIYRTKRGRVLCWICATAIAWGTAFAFGEQVMLTLLTNNINEATSSHVSIIPPFIYALSVGSMCFIIGLITGAALIWLGGNQPSVSVRHRHALIHPTP
jgi:hypothetical protein